MTAINWYSTGEYSGELSENEKKKVIDRKFEEYYTEKALFGDIEKCMKLVDNLYNAGVTEIINLIDFGVDDQLVLSALPSLAKLNTIIENKYGYIKRKNGRVTRKLGNPPQSIDLTSPMEKVDYKRFIRCSFAQERLWFIDQYNDGDTHFYNEPIVLILRGDVDCLALEKSCNKLLERHLGLRTVFVESAGLAFKKVVDFEYQ